MNTVNTVNPFPAFSLYTRAYGGNLTWRSQWVQVFTGHAVGEQWCSLNNALRVGARITRIAALLARSWVSASAEICHRIRNSLKNRRFFKGEIK